MSYQHLESGKLLCGLYASAGYLLNCLKKKTKLRQVRFIRRAAYLPENTVYTFYFFKFLIVQYYLLNLENCYYN